MENEIGYNVGTIEDEIMGGDNPHKFIIVKNGNNLVYHSKSSEWGSRLHETIAKMLGIEEKNILAGGYAEFPDFLGDKDTMRIYGKSTHFGAVPQEILFRFPQERLLNAYKRLNPEIQKVNFNIFGEVKDHWKRYL